MDFIVDLFVEVIFGAVFEGTLELFERLARAFVPNKLRLGKVGKLISALVAVVMIVALIAGIFAVLFSAGKAVWGWILLAVPVIFIPIAVVVAIINRKNKK